MTCFQSVNLLFIDGSCIWNPMKSSLSCLTYFSDNSSAGIESSCNIADPGSIPGSGRSPEKGKATHSSILSWRIPWTIQSMGSQRVGHNWATFTFT